MSRFSPLQPWFDRRDPLRSFAKIDTAKPNPKLGGFIGLDVCVPLHEIGGIAPENLEDSWKRIDDYVTHALEIIDANEPLWLDHDEVEMITEELGLPPSSCYPIYLVTVGSGLAERVVYIGRTSAKTARFSTGHHVVTKLHAPQYSGMSKQLYQCCVTLLDDKDYLPLEWIHPLSSACEILASVEAQLIYNFQTVLNTHHRKKYNASFPFIIHIQNFSGHSEYLHDTFVYPI